MPALTVSVGAALLTSILDSATKKGDDLNVVGTSKATGGTVGVTVAAGAATDAAANSFAAFEFKSPKNDDTEMEKVSPSSPLFKPPKLLLLLLLLLLLMVVIMWC